MNPNETRSSHPSSAQVESLVEFMERNPGLAKGFLRTQNARERGRRQWEELAVRLNSLGGTIKNYKQWTKYWSDKKSAIKKKVAARAAARRRTGGGVEDEVELSELEERIVALCGGEGFSIGDTHLGIQPFPETNTLSPSHQERIQNTGTDNADVSQRPGTPTEEQSAIIFLDSEQIANSAHRNRLSADSTVARRLFDSSSSSAVGTSQNILQDIRVVETVPSAHSYHPSLSPPPITLSHTPSPLPMLSPSPSRRGSTRVVRVQNAASSSLRHSPSTTSSRRARAHNMARASRGSASVSSRHTGYLPATVAPPPSQRRTEFSTITERFLRVEEQNLELQRSNARILQSIMEREAERETILAAAVTAVGKGLKAVGKGLETVAEAIKGNRNN